MTVSSGAAGLAAAAGAVALLELVALRVERPRHDRRRRRAWPLLARLGRRLGVAPAPVELSRRLAAAGSPGDLAPADVVAMRAALALVALVVVAAPASALPGRLGPVALVAAPLAALYAPDLWLRRRARLRARRMGEEAADVLDLLRVCVEAGRPAAACLGEVGRRHRGLLGAELRRASRLLALGEPRRRVQEELAARCPLREVAALVAALERADRHGAPLAPALSALAADARAARARAVRDRAARAAPKIQLVVALLLVPAVMLLVGAALAGAFAGAT